MSIWDVVFNYYTKKFPKRPNLIKCIIGVEKEMRMFGSEALCLYYFVGIILLLIIIHNKAIQIDKR